ncbi:MAG: bifunctional folylpolyglutamate synthase/dihydrofolate synthase [Pseudomonadota bacterium]|nr:bifunctional folylpolyglutamate synthase/dihydrofolate synthase [Pseudomonadota bacterium]
MSLEPAGVQAALDRFLALHPKLIDLSLDRLDALLEDLGRPERAMPPAIHVAGTNGKGSTLAFLKAIIEASGKTAHVYTSPHLVRFAERIQLRGQTISDERLLDVLTRVQDANGDQPGTFFELTTAAAFIAFSETPADFVLLETGLGGRLDATNILPPEAVALSLISQIGIDHQHFLGDGIEAIAREKAGIFKPGVRAFFAPQQETVRTILLEEADRRGTLALPAQPVGVGVTLGLPGGFQRDNAGLAAAAAADLGIDERSIAAGLARAQWAARLSLITSGTLWQAAGAGRHELRLDGAHNADAGAAIAASLRGGGTGDGPGDGLGDRPLYLLYGLLETKDAQGFLAPLLPHVAQACAVQIPGAAASLSDRDAAAAASALGRDDVTTADSLQAGLKSFADAPPGLVLVCGSLYLAGAFLAENQGLAPTANRKAV